MAHTLADVGKRALDDPSFWHELCANPRRALEHAGYALEPTDLAALEEALTSNRVVFDFRQFIEGAHNMAPRVRWTGRWVGGWAGRWPPLPPA